MVALGFVLASAGSGLAGADMEPVIVIPGRPDVPVMMYGQDVRGAVIVGDWGLAQEGVGITIIRPGLGSPVPGPPLPAYYGPLVGPFFPGTGRKPRVGRHEVIPPANRPLPPRAESFQRGWWTESPNLPANIEQPQYPMPLVGVEIDRGSRRHGPRQAPDR